MTPLASRSTSRRAPRPATARGRGGRRRGEETDGNAHGAHPLPIRGAGATWRGRGGRTTRRGRPAPAESFCTGTRFRTPVCPPGPPTLPCFGAATIQQTSMVSERTPIAAIFDRRIARLCVNSLTNHRLLNIVASALLAMPSRLRRRAGRCDVRRDPASRPWRRAAAMPSAAALPTPPRAIGSRHRYSASSALGVLQLHDAAAPAAAGQRVRGRRPGDRREEAILGAIDLVRVEGGRSCAT